MFNGRRQPSGGGASRMTRECQVRFCERLGVQFHGPTRQNENPASWGLCQLPPATDIQSHGESCIVRRRRKNVAQMTLRPPRDTLLQTPNQNASHFSAKTD